MVTAFTLGHENAGWVHALGTGVTGLEVGQPVAVYGPWGCGRCARCRLGIETYCDNPAAAPIPGGGGGLGLDGGMAEFMLIPDARFLVPLPEGLDPVTAAPLTDAALTPYHAVAPLMAEARAGNHGGGRWDRGPGTPGGPDPQGHHRDHGARRRLQTRSPGRGGTPRRGPRDSGR